ncbi:MAG: hypothetical protein M3321_02910 [Actinomycetota bacterium]|nr:hypothetical protein [Actinomycetota bacterium]
MRRLAVRLALVAAAVCAGCGGGGGESDPENRGVQAFPDVLEIARAELGDTAPLHAATVSETQISFVNVQIGRTVRVIYNPDGVFTGSERVRVGLNPAATFSIADVPRDAPGRLLAAVQEREDGEVTAFAATLARGAGGTLVWRAQAQVDGAARTYQAALDGSLTG